MKFLADESLRGPMVRALQRTPGLDVVRVQDVGLSGADDPTILEWAAEQERLLLTHDKHTIPNYAYERVTSGRLMPGVIVVPVAIPIATVVDDLRLFAACSLEHEWDHQLLYLPLRSRGS